MNLRDVLVVHTLIGGACAVAVYRRGAARGPARIASAILAIPLWPLWAPFALGGPAERRSLDVVARISAALQTALAAVAGTPLERLLTRAEAARIAHEVRATAARLQMIDDLAVRSPALGDAAEGAVVAARLQTAARVRLLDVRARHARTLAEIADLLDVLSTQLALTRLGESSPDAAAETLAEIWARLDQRVAEPPG